MVQQHARALRKLWICIRLSFVRQSQTLDKLLDGLTDSKERTLRLVAAQGITEELEPDVFRHNSKSLAYITGTSKFFFKIL